MNVHTPADVDDAVAEARATATDLRDWAELLSEPDLRRDSKSVAFEEAAQVIEKLVALLHAERERLVETGRERTELRNLLRERHEFPESPTPDWGEVWTEEDEPARQAWNEKYDALDGRIKEALG